MPRSRSCENPNQIFIRTEAKIYEVAFEQHSMRLKNEVQQLGGRDVFAWLTFS